MSKGLNIIKAMRPDLATLETRHVQARVTISICDSGGVPRAKDRFFVVTPRVARTVTIGGQKQDRSDPMPGFEAWNFAQGKASSSGAPIVGGLKSFTMRIQHPNIEDAYHVGCRAQKDPGGIKSPGRTPFCSTVDGITAKRWDGNTFAEMPCQGAACSLRQYHGEGSRRSRPAKTVFNVVGRLAEDDFPPLLVSIGTGSDMNLREFIGLVDDAERQWATMCDLSGMSTPLSWYGLPIRLTVFESTGDETRFPRIHWALGCDLEEVFQTSIERRVMIANMGGTLRLPPPARMLITPEIEDADEVEVIHPARIEAPRRSASESLRGMVAYQETSAEDGAESGSEPNPDLDDALDKMTIASEREIATLLKSAEGWHTADQAPLIEAATKRREILKAG